MRISDWSSDVCSSDLAFGMKLDAVYRQLDMVEAHYRTIVARRIDDESGGNVDNLEAVIASRLEWRRQASIETAVVVAEGGGVDREERGGGKGVGSTV